jgi:hypothetical protein
MKDVTPLPHAPGQATGAKTQLIFTATFLLFATARMSNTAYYLTQLPADEYQDHCPRLAVLLPSQAFTTDKPNYTRKKSMY